MREDDSHLVQQLSEEKAQTKVKKLTLDEGQFRWAMNEDAMATEKLAQGIRAFAADQVKLEKLVSQYL